MQSVPFWYIGYELASPPLGPVRAVCNGTVDSVYYSFRPWYIRDPGRGLHIGKYDDDYRGQRLGKRHRGL